MLISFEVDAAFGISWKIGDYIQKGYVLGKMPGDQKILVTAPQPGFIQNVIFDAAENLLTVELRVNKK